MEALRTTFDLFQCLTKKSVARGQPLEAIAFHHASTLRPLVEPLRIRHCPQRHAFGLRLVHHDLPSISERRSVGSRDMICARRRADRPRLRCTAEGVPTT